MTKSTKTHLHHRDWANQRIKALGPSIGKPGGRVRLPRLDGDGDGLTSILSPVGEDNIPVANVVGRYAALGVELIDRDILEDRLNGMSINDAGLKYGMPRGEVRKREVRLMQAMKKLGESIPAPVLHEAGSTKPKPVFRSLSPKQQAELADDLEAGTLTIAELAKKYRVSRGTISTAIKRFNKPQQPIAKLRQENLLADLDKEILDGKMTPKELADKYGIRISYVSKRRNDLKKMGTIVPNRKKGRKTDRTAPISIDILEGKLTAREISEKYGVTREAVRTRAKRLGVATSGVRKKRSSYGPTVRGANKKTGRVIQEIEQYLIDNPNESLIQAAKKFGINYQTALKYIDESVLGGGRGKPISERTRAIVNRYDELIKELGLDKENIRVRDRSALAALISEELGEPPTTVSLIISRVTVPKEKRTKSGKLTSALNELNERLANGEKLSTAINETAKKWNTTPNTLRAVRSAQSLSDNDVKIIERYEQIRDSDDYFKVSRSQLVAQIAKELGVKASTVQARLSAYYSTRKTQAARQKEFKSKKITQSDFDMLDRLVSGENASDIARSLNVTEAFVNKRVTLLKGLLRKYNYWPRKRQAEPTSPIPTPRPYPAVRPRNWPQVTLADKSIREQIAIKQILKLRSSQ